MREVISSIVNVFVIITVLFVIFILFAPTYNTPPINKQYLCIDGYQYVYLPKIGLSQQFKNNSHGIECIPCVERHIMD